MLKRLFLAALLALAITGASTHATAEPQWPVCFPCD
jgi:hypothetical protein